MTYRELTRKLRRLGCYFDRQGRGGHEIWMNADSRTRTTIPNWGSRDLRPGTIGAILHDLGISRDDFERV
ncbi:MAG: type II toxin-antitoxin system HicA family toxin [Chloroflexota bacterium]|nr:type II toxin-antitoxin system HicA family toxin [Chloroflexota bacterium]MDE2961862.1 type II toxin-antitoxin system HicA family toxin [Chloroflexota bacterium]